MASTILAFQLLTLIIFCITNGQGIDARDLKVRGPYTEGYKTRTHDLEGPYNVAYNGYIIHTHDSKGHPTHVYSEDATHTHDLDKPYNAAYNGYTTLTHDSKGSYNAVYNGYTTHNHDSKGPLKGTYSEDETHIHDLDEPYNAAYNGYTTHTHDSEGSYNAAYNGYSAHTHDSKEPLKDTYSEDETHTHDFDGSYNAAYNGYAAHNHDSKGSYNGYTIHTHDSKRPPTGAYSEDETHTHDLDGPYNAAYNGYITHIHDLNGPKSLPSRNLNRKEAHKSGFFTLDDIYVGNVMKLQFSIQKVSPYLSKKEAESIPFSISQFQSVLQLFSIPQDSPQAKSMRHTLELCADKPITGETKICANSLESMLEFVDKVIGSNTKHNILTTSHPSPSATPLQNYTILEVSHDINAPKWVSCHPLPYPYAIYYCHYIATGTKIFKVSLVGDKNGDKIEALGICHMDTSDWSPDLILFKQLGITAGKNSPVCHFFPIRNILWVPRNSDATGI